MSQLACPYCGKPMPVRNTVRAKVFRCPSCGGYAKLSAAATLKSSVLMLAALGMALVVVRILGVRDTTTADGFAVLAGCLTVAYLGASWAHSRTPPVGPLKKVTGHRDWPD